LKSRAASNGLQALRVVARERGDHKIAPARTRIALEQLYYYLGNIQLSEVQDTLENLISEEPDPWLRRGLAIGLAFSGRGGPIAHYIEELRTERDVHGNDAPLSAVNVGTALSYFGDQPFDPTKPDVDAGLPGCGRTIATFLYQLTTDTERGCWRIDLHTFVDLWRWRSIAGQSIRLVVVEREDEVKALLTRLRSDPFCNGWVQLDDFEAVIAECLGSEDHENQALNDA
jgi:hypothetical protein